MRRNTSGFVDVVKETAAPALALQCAFCAVKAVAYFYLLGHQFFLDLPIAFSTAAWVMSAAAPPKPPGCPSFCCPFPSSSFSFLNIFSATPFVPFPSSLFSYISPFRHHHLSHLFSSIFFSLIFGFPFFLFPFSSFPSPPLPSFVVTAVVVVLTIG